MKNNLPVTNVSPEQAQAFCAWIGGRLPTEIEWESAVRGPQDRGFPFPWGSDAVTRERSQIFHGDPDRRRLRPGAGREVDGRRKRPGPHERASATQPNGARTARSRAVYILRGCSFQTANMDDIRVTWRGRGDARGDEDTGIRVVIPLIETITRLAQIVGARNQECDEQHQGEGTEVRYVSSIQRLRLRPRDRVPVLDN